MVQLQVNEQVMSAYEDLFMSKKKQIPTNGQRQPPVPLGNGQPTNSGHQP